MISQGLRGFSKSRVINPLFDPQPPAWTFPPGAPKLTGIGHSSARMLGGNPVNTGDASKTGPRGFAPAIPEALVEICLAERAGRDRRARELSVSQPWRGGLSAQSRARQSCPPFDWSKHMLSSDDVARANRVQQLAEHLMLDQVEDLMLAQLKRLAREYTWHARDPRISVKQRTFSELITIAYNLSRMFADDLEWYHRFDGVLLEKEEGQQDFTLANIFEAVLLYAFADEAHRWRKHAIKLAARLPKLSDTPLAAADIVHGLELVIAYEKFR